MDKNVRKQKCRVERAAHEKLRESIPNIVEEYLLTCDIKTCFDHIGPDPIPSRDSTIKVLHKIK
ncbi:MAG: hypothetical protein ACMUJM_07705 [bacterium]